MCGEASKRFCMYPHGWTSMFVMVTAALVHAITMNIALGCYYVRIRIQQPRTDGEMEGGILNATFATSSSLSSVPSQVTGLGLFTYEDPLNPRSCTAYKGVDSDNFDKVFHVARAFGFMSSLLSAGCMLTLLSISCISFTPAALKFLVGLCWFGSVSEALTLLLFATNVCQQESGCSVHVGAILGIIASVVAFGNGILILHFPPAQGQDDDSFFDDSSRLIPGTTNISEITLPDGSKKIVKTKVNSDGSQTVEETIRTTTMSTTLEQRDARP